MTQVVIAHIGENAITVASSSLPTPVITNEPVILGVKYTWSLTIDIRPFLWTYRLNIAGAGFGAWIDTVNNSVDVFLTKDQADADSTSVIAIEVKSTDGVNFGTLDTDSATTLRNSVNAGDYVTRSVNTADMVLLAVNTTLLAADAVTGAKIADNAITTDHIISSAITLDLMSANSVSSNQYVDGSINTVHIGADQITGALIADNQINSEHYIATSIDNEHIANSTIEIGKQATSSLAQMFESNGRGRLDRIFYSGSTSALITIDNLAVSDRILIADGTNKNVTDFSVALKHATTGLAIDNVENKSGATIIADELDDTALNATTTAVLDVGVITAINSLGTTINNVRVAPITVASQLAISSQQFHADGNLITGIRFNATIRTVENLTNAVDGSGQATNLDLTNINTGDSSNITQNSAARFLGAGEKTAIGYLDGNVHTDGANLIGVYDGGNAVSASSKQLVERASGRRVVWAENNTGSPVTDFTVHTVSVAAAKAQFQYIQFMKCDGDDKMYITGLGYMGGATIDGVLTIELRDAGGNVIASGLTGTVDFASGAAITEYEASLTIPSEDPDGTMYQVWLGLTGGAADTTNFKGGILSVDQV